MEKVSVRLNVLIGIVAIAALSLLAVAFLLGRASAPGGPAGRSSSQEFAGAGAEPPRPSPRTWEPPMPALPQVPDPVASPVGAIPQPFIVRGPGQQPASGSSPGPVPGVGRGDGADPSRSAVAAYFEAIDSIQPGKLGGSAESVATEMASALANGDTSSLDRLIRDTEAARARLATISPPEPCASHHRESLASVDEALEMLRSLRSAMQSPDPVAQLAGVANRAGALRTRSETLAKEEESLRERYGLKR